MSLDALSSVAYGPEAIVLGLIAAGTAAVSLTVPIALAITALLLVLVVSYRQVIAVHPDGGGSYAVAKKDLGRWPALLAAASLVVDYVLTVAVSLAAARNVREFIGFTISQTGLVRHWFTERGPRWLGNALLNGVGAVLTAVAGIVLLASKFTEGAWLLLFLVPGLVVLMDRIERYYKFAGEQLGLGRIPEKPVAATATGGIVVVPIVAVSCVAERALQTAMRFGCDVVPITVEVDPESTQRLCAQWQEWNPGFELKVLPRPHRSLVAPTVHFVKTEIDNGRDVTVLLSQVEPRRWRHRLLYNQRGPILEAALRARTSAIITSMSVRID
jgi:amino acid transporter